MKLRWFVFGLGGLACTPGEAPSCDGDGSPELQIGQRLLDEGPAPTEGPIRYGNPPQGGAPYAPFEIRMRWPIDTSTRVTVSAVATERETGEELGSAAQSQAFFCANAGGHVGWRFGGEVHVRFWGIELHDLEGRHIDLDVDLQLPEGEAASVSTSGPLVLAL